MITRSIEVKRRPEDVFAYLDDLERHSEWQPEIISTNVETEGPVRVGTRVHEMRTLGRREMDSSYEITEHDPPRKSSFRGTVGSVRPVGTVSVEPVGDGSSSRVTIEFNLVGHGMGKLIAPLARRQAPKVIEGNQQKLKEMLEGGAEPAS
jgi:carbon monoxide dehydrogenase subunit G